MIMYGIDLTANAWFAQDWADKVTEMFICWWLLYYGRPEDYETVHGEQEEYWVRCSFALAGFLAGKESTACAS